MRTDAAYAQDLDRQEPLASFREQFVITEPELIYLDGNSLGRPRRRMLCLRSGSPTGQIG
jgi:kynureninase